MLPFTYCHDAGSTTVREGASILDDEGGKRSFAAIDSNVGGADKAVIRFWRFADAASLSLLSGEGH